MSEDHYGCMVTPGIHRYFIECFQCPDWHTDTERKSQAIQVASDHYVIEHERKSGGAS